MGRGLLTFKGDSPKKKGKKKVKHGVSDKADDPTQKEVAAAAPQPATIPTTCIAKPPSQPQIKIGSGKITTSGMVVTGHGTRFSKEVHVGDAMICGEEMRVVKMVLSDTSCGISSSFSKSIINPTTYQVIAKPKNEAAEAKQLREALNKERNEVEQSAFGTFKGTSELVYRERTEHGGYRIRQVGLEESKSRTELLAMRSKKTSDKYC
jgi:hypothetical protein